MLIFVLVAIGVMARREYRISQGSGTASTWSNLPPQGRYENNTNGVVPGNPENAYVDLRRIFGAVQVYKDAHGGQYPNTSELFGDMVYQNERYGIHPGASGRVSAVLDIFTNPDAEFADDPFLRKHVSSNIAYVLQKRRQDATLVGTPKQKGTRDVIASTNIYVHENVRRLPHSRGTVNPVGFYVVLWDDGKIDRISYDEVLYVPSAGNDFHVAFPGQAGVPKNALSYKQFYTQAAHWHIAPHGAKGSTGEFFYGKTSQ